MHFISQFAALDFICLRELRPGTSFLIPAEAAYISPMSSQKYLHGRARSFRYAFQGIATLFRTQPNTKIHLVATILVMGLGFLLDVSLAEWGFLVIAIMGV